jgi:hypothetical protein
VGALRSQGRTTPSGRMAPQGSRNRKGKDRTLTGFTFDLNLTTQ